MATVDISELYFQTDTAAPTATVDISEMYVQLDPPAGGVHAATVDISSMYFAANAGATTVNRWILDGQGELVPILARHFLASDGSLVS